MYLFVHFVLVVSCGLVQYRKLWFLLLLVLWVCEFWVLVFWVFFSVLWFGCLRVPFCFGYLGFVASGGFGAFVILVLLGCCLWFRRFIVSSIGWWLFLFACA